MIAHTPAEVAARIGTTEAWIRLQARNGTPHLRLERGRIAFTDAQIQQLIDRATHTTTTQPTTGLTTRRRRRAA